MKYNCEIHTLSWIKKNKNRLDDIGTDALDITLNSTTICSILANIPCSNIILEEHSDSNKYSVLQGKELLLSILGFIDNNFEIVDNEIRQELLDSNIIGKHFSDLQAEQQEGLLDYELSISVMRPLENYERTAIVKLYSEIRNTNLAINVTSHTPLISPSPEKSSMDLKLEEYLNHPFFSKVNIPLQLINTDIILQLLIVKEDGVERELSSTNLLKFKESLDDIPKIKPTLDFLNKAYKDKDSSLKKSHLPMIFLCANKAVLNKLCTPGEFHEIIKNFFEINNPEYKEASNSRTSNRNNVNTRIRIMLNYFNERVK